MAEPKPEQMPKLVETEIPDDDRFTTLEATLNVLKKYFPEVYQRVQAKVPGWIEEITSGSGRDADQIRDDIFKHSVGVDLMVQTLGIKPSTANKIILGKNEGGLNFGEVLQLPKVQEKLGIPQPGDAPKEGTAPGKTDKDPNTLPGVLRGGKTIRVGTGANARWYQMYEFPPGSGQFVAYQFSDLKQAEATLGKGFEFTNTPEAWFDRRVLAEAQAEEVIGLGGTWGQMTQEVMQDAANAAGARDPSVIGQMARNPEMQQIMAQALIGDWTPEQILAEQRKTNFWQNVLYPGIKAFYGKTTDPEKAWNNYKSNVEPALVALGYKKDAAGTYNDVVKRMLDAGIDSQIFLENAPIFQQAVQNQQFFQVLRQRAQAELGKDIDFGQWFTLLKGEAAPEIAKVAEGAVLAYEAKQADFKIAESQLQRLINQRDMSAEEARNVFSEVNQATLALGERALSRGNLSRDDILSAAAGIAPQSGMSADEVRLKVAKLAQENDLFDEDKLSFYVGFDTAGRPTRPGLSSLAPEGA